MYITYIYKYILTYMHNVHVLNIHTYIHTYIHTCMYTKLFKLYMEVCYTPQYGFYVLVRALLRGL